MRGNAAQGRVGDLHKAIGRAGARRRHSIDKNKQFGGVENLNGTDLDIAIAVGHGYRISAWWQTVIAAWHSVAYNSGSTAHGNGSGSVQSSIWDIFPVVSVGRQPAGNANPDRSVVITGQRTTTGEVYRKISRDDRCAVDADKAYFLGSVEHLDLRKVSRKFYRSIGTRQIGRAH